MFFHSKFMLRKEVLRLYCDVLRAIREIPEESVRSDLKHWARSDFRANMHHTDELTIKMMLQYGRRSLNELKTNLELSGLYKFKGAVKSDSQRKE